MPQIHDQPGLRWYIFKSYTLFTESFRSDIRSHTCVPFTDALQVRRFVVRAEERDSGEVMIMPLLVHCPVMRSTSGEAAAMLRIKLVAHVISVSSFDCDARLMTLMAQV